MNNDPRDEPKDGEGRREPMINAPWPAVLLAVLILAARMAHSIVGDTIWNDLAFSPVDLTNGRWMALATNLLVYQDWMSALFIAIFALAFATPTVRWLGPSLQATTSIGTLYILGGIVGGFAHALSHVGDTRPFSVGIAGVAALAGAASRLYGQEGRPGPLWSPLSIGLLLAGVVMYLLQSIAGRLSGGSGPAEAVGALAGFAAGLLLIGPFIRLARPSYRQER